MWFAVYQSRTDLDPSWFESYDGIQCRTGVPEISIWAKVYMEDGTYYYWNRETDETFLEKPALEIVSPEMQIAAEYAEAVWGDTWSFKLHFAGSDPRHTGDGLTCDFPLVPSKRQSITWIQVRHGNTNSSYFWDPARGIARNAPPKRHLVKWLVAQDPNGRWHCWDPSFQAVEYEFPDLPPPRPPTDISWLALDMSVQVNLSRRRRFDGCSGQIVRIGDGLVTIQLPSDLCHSIVQLNQGDVGPCRPGGFLTLRGLAREELNGQECQVVSPVFDTSRYIVRLSDGSLISVKMACTKVVPRLRNLDYGSVPRRLVWHGEQACSFVDNCGVSHRFALQLPQKFDLDRHGTWPVIFFLRGTGRTSFFEQERRVLSSEGLLFAFRNFVVVSPVVDSPEVDSPWCDELWILELVQHLISARWANIERIYLTGCEMGGTGTWVLAARDSGLFAAIAPIFALGAPELTHEIVMESADTPICIVHSTRDRSPALQKHLSNWAALKASNPQLTIWLCEFCDYQAMLNAVYWRGTRLFEWFLRHRREPR